MTDVFISYAREDRALAQALATDLKVRGYRVWWDTELVGSDDFQDVIRAALVEARAVIVIWTKASIKSHFVRDEARYALHANKLATSKQPDLDILDLPFGFQGQHADEVENREQIVKAITKLGAAPKVNSGTADASNWERVKTSKEIGTVLTWLESNPGHEKQREAIARTRELLSLTGAPERVIGGSNWSAFISGLCLRTRGFQLAEESKWSAMGLSVSLFGVLVGGAYLAVRVVFGLIERLSGRAALEDQRVLAVAFLLTGIVYLLFAWFTKSHITSFIRERLFAAAYIITPLFCLLLGMGLGCFAFAAMTTRMTVDQLDISVTAPSVALAAFAVGVLSAAGYVVSKANAAR